MCHLYCLYPTYSDLPFSKFCTTIIPVTYIYLHFPNLTKAKGNTKSPSPVLLKKKSIARTVHSKLNMAWFNVMVGSTIYIYDDF